MSAPSPTLATKPPVWRNVRFLRALGQVIFVVIVVVVAQQLFLNLQYGLERVGQEDVSFKFLGNRAGFQIDEGIAYSPNETFLKAFMVGVMNTVRVAVVGIVLSSIWGLILGVSRLSPNWIVRKLAQGYVDIVRNTPLLIQVIFMYTAVILALPAFSKGASLGSLAFISNRGAAVTWFNIEDRFAVWALFLVGGLVAGFVMWRRRTRVNEATGDPSYRLTYAFLTFLGVAIVGYFVLGGPISLNVPEAGPRAYVGGAQLSPEFTAILLSLVIYTSAFIAEIVRGSILAVSKGQKEAAEALGFTPGQQLRLVVLPQALRIAIPPINSQYLNLAKNSSLAFAIGYAEIVNVSTTISNQSSKTFQIIAMAMGTFLAISLIISTLMNIANRAVATKGTGR